MIEQMAQMATILQMTCSNIFDWKKYSILIWKIIILVAYV